MALPHPPSPGPGRDPGPEPASPLAEAPTFGAVHEEERDGLVRVAFLLLGNRTSAEEVVQDAFVKLHLRWTSVRDPGAFLRVCVVNASRDRLRRRRRLAERLPRLAADPIHHDDRTIELADVLLTLPHRQRAAVVGRYYAGWDDHEIAEALGVRLATVRSLVHRGLAALRAQLDPSPTPEPEEPR